MLLWNSSGFDVYEIENGKFIEFDKELFDKNFKAMQENRISVCSRLPETILEKIADIRVFALGYATPEVKKLLRTYCKELSDELAEVKKIAYRQTVFAEMKLHKVIDVDELNENCDSDLLSLENKNGDIYIGSDAFTIDERGVIRNENQEVIDTLLLTYIPPDADVHKEGDSLFLYEGDPVEIPADEEFAVIQKAYEKSNVDTVKEMTQAMEAHRMYEAASRILRGFDSINQQAVKIAEL